MLCTVSINVNIFFETNSSVMNNVFFARYDEHVAPCFQPIESIIKQITCMWNMSSTNHDSSKA
jgi:hypothetical protein